jgi:predicted transposase YdaD
MAKLQDKSNKYDKIIKENIEPCVLSLINQFFGLNITLSQLSEIDVSIRKTIEREADIVKKVNFKNTKDDFLLHIEFQSKNENDMHFRMLEYYAFMTRKHKLPIQQYVIYIGDEAMKMESHLQHSNIQFRFQIINIRDINYQEFIKSDIPEFVILGILAGFGQDSPEKASENILERIVTITNTNPRYKNTLAKEKYLKQIDVISQLRGLQNIIIETIKNMALTLDITKDLRYIEGEMKGEIKGEIKERNKNILKGYSKGMKIEELADFFEVSLDYVKKVIQNQHK